MRFREAVGARGRRLWSRMARHISLDGCVSGLGVALFCAVAFAPEVLAQATTGGTSSNDPLQPALDGIQTIGDTTLNIYRVSALLGVVALALVGMFGRFPWQKAFGLSGGLLIVAFVDKIVDFVFGLTGFSGAADLVN